MCVPYRPKMNGEPSAASARWQAKGAMSLILVVEDEDCLRTLAEDILQMKGHQVVTAESGSEAVRFLPGQVF
jgi:response regulator RpfG family c-di-GMP phosphodiesterase